MWPSTTGPSTTSTTSSGARRPFADPDAHGPASRSSTCSPGATRARSSPSCARGSSGTGSTTRSPAGRGAQRLAVTSGGTIPDRGLYAVFLATGDGPGRRVGELDEEMVYESRVGDLFTLGTSTWRIEDITHDRVLVTPAPGLPGRLPFWKGDSLGRPAELGRAVGAFVREVVGLPADAARAPGHARRASTSGPPTTSSPTSPSSARRPGTSRTTRRSSSSGSATSSATGGSPSTARSARRSTPRGRWPCRPGCASGSGSTSRPCTATTASSSGCRTSSSTATAATVRARRRARSSCSPSSPTRSTTLVTDEIGGSAVFAARFRECAARALLLPRRRPDRRQPLWQQRQRAAQLLEVASRYPTFPIVLEAVREVVQDVFDVPGLTSLMRDLEARRVRLVEVESAQPSPFARSLLFGYVAQFLYEGDSPLAERRAAALSLDPALLAELLGTGEGLALRDLLDAEQIERTAGRAAAPRARAGLPRRRGRRRPAPRTRPAADRRRPGPVRPRASATHVGGWLVDLEAARRVIRVGIAGRGALGRPSRTPPGCATPSGPRCRSASRRPSSSRCRTRSATSSPGTRAPTARSGRPTSPRRFGLGSAVAATALARLVTSGRVVEGEFLPVESGASEFCDAEVLRLLRRRSLASLRAEVEPVTTSDLARFLPAWQGVGEGLRGREGLLRAVEQLSGAVLPASAVETLVLPGRVAGYSPALLDELMAAGEVLWCGHGSLARDDGWVSLHLADTAALTLPEPDANPPRRPRRCSTPCPAAAPSSSGPSRTCSAPPTTVPSQRRCGTSCGPVTSPATPSPRSGPSSPAGAAPTGRTGPARGPGGMPAGAAASARSAAGRRVRPCPSAPDRRASSAAGACCPSATSTPPAGPTPSPSSSSTATGSSRGERWPPRTCQAGSPPSIGSSPPPRRPAASDAATSSSPSAPPSSARPVPSTGCAARRAGVGSGTGAPAPARRCSRRATRPTPTARRSAGPPDPPGEPTDRTTRTRSEPGPGTSPAARPAPSSSSSTASSSSTSSAEAAPCCPGPRTPRRCRPAADALALAVREGALGRLTVERADGDRLLGSDHPLVAALEAAGFRATPRGLRLRR